jgi:hypothetical protein
MEARVMIDVKNLRPVPLSVTPSASKLSEEAERRMRLFAKSFVAGGGGVKLNVERLHVTLAVMFPGWTRDETTIMEGYIREEMAKKKTP